MKLLTDLLKGGAKTLEWTVSAQEAFQIAKRLLAAAVPLQNPAPNAELSLAIDASDTYIGGVMQQKSGDHWRPLGFFSRKLTATESRYSTFDRELLAAHAAITYFRHFCEGRAFQLWTDHKQALTFTLISRFGVPETITSDHGPQFTSNLWFQLCEMLNISHKQTTAYNPESNGAVKRLHCHLDDALRARDAAATLSGELPFVLLGLSAQPREDTGLSPAEAVFGA